MKRNSKSFINILCGVSLATMLGCGDAYDQDPNKDAQPTVQTLIFDDALNPASVAALGSAEAGATFSVRDATDTSPAKLLPFVRPTFQFNKLMSGSTLEGQLGTDATTGKPIGKCIPNGGAYNVKEGATAINSATLFTCYNPSDHLVSVQLGDGSGGRKLFWKYNTSYSIELTTEAKDKAGRALTPYTLNFTTTPFEVLSLTDSSGASIFYSSSNWKAERSKVKDDDGNDTAEFLKVANKSKTLRILFSGPISDGKTDTATLAGAKLIKVGSPGEVTSTGPNGTKTALFSHMGLGDDGKPTKDEGSTDPRVLFVYHPDYVAGIDKTSATYFTEGDYQIVLPAALSDAQTPATALGADVTIDFSVGPPAT